MFLKQIPRNADTRVAKSFFNITGLRRIIYCLKTIQSQTCYGSRVVDYDQYLVVHQRLMVSEFTRRFKMSSDTASRYRKIYVCRTDAKNSKHIVTSGRL